MIYYNEVELNRLQIITLQGLVLGVNDILNPYIAGAPVVETSMFFGREDVFSWIERSLEGKYVDHILVLHGQRRVGKTSVLKQIPNFLPDKYIQVFFDLQGRTNTTLERFLWWLAREIIRTLNHERGSSLPRPDRSVFEADPETLITQFLPSIRPALDNHVLLLTFDEFDTLERPEIQETLAKPLINYLRRLMDIERLSFIFSIGSSGNKLENMQASYTEFFKSALYRKISFLSKDDCFRLITKPVEGILRYDPKVVDLIYEITSGHPYFTQLMCHELFSQCQKSGARSITSPDVDAILDDVIERGTVNLKFVWDEATELEKWILTSLAQIESGATTHQLYTNLQGQQIHFSEPDIYSAIIRLRDKDILNRDNHFVVHLLPLWLKRNRPFDRVREELAEINPIVNRYIEIADTFRDQGKAAKAIENYRYALEQDPDCTNALVNIGNLLVEKGDYEQAATVFESALSIDDENIAALTGAGDTYLAWGDRLFIGVDFDQASHKYLKVLGINPDHIEARNRLANLNKTRAEGYLASGQDEAALIAFATARDYAPEDHELTKRVDEVIGEKKVQVLTSLATQAEKAQENGNWEAAITAVQNALLISGTDEILQAKLAQLQDSQREYLLTDLPLTAEKLAKAEAWDEAIDTWQDYLDLSPPNPDEAQVALDKARQMETIQAKYKQALDRTEAKDYPQAIELLREIIQVDPTYKDVTDLLARAVRASRRVRPNWRKIAWYAIPILLMVVIASMFFALQDRGGLAAIAFWRNTATPTHTVTQGYPTPESTPIPSQTTSPTSPPTITPTFTRTAISYTPTATPPPSWVTDFTEPILAAIAGRQPDFQDDFSDKSGGWTKATFCANWGDLNFDEGELTISGSCWIFRDMWYPDFVAELDYHFLPGTGTAGSHWGFKYRHLAGGADAASNAYKFHYSGDVSAELVTSSTLDRGSVETTFLQDAALRGTNTNHVLVIAKGQAYALYINSRPVFHKIGNPIWPNGAIQFDMDDTVAIDNFKIWDISGISLEATPAP
jgi:tetratricopeptide (TPR) repeat protein